MTHAAMTSYDRGAEVIARALADDRTGLRVLLASLDAPELRRLLDSTVCALADTVAGRCEAAGVPRREAAAYFRESHQKTRRDRAADRQEK